MIKTKDDLFRTICNASRLGNLGFFIGSGFSKAVLEGNTRYQAYSWGELLKRCCEKLNVDESIMKSYCSYPELATNICKEYANLKGISFEDSVKEFKTKVSELTNSYPEQSQRENYGKWFEAIKPSWVTTTNYDTIIESILGGLALPISPNGCFCNINGMIPVYHLHGICYEPSEIIITNEDYTYMFRPNDYRQARLPFLIKESCVLMMGYGLGDINVITAVDWANNVYTNANEGYDFPIIQLLYTETPKADPYVNKDNVVIYEISSIENFFAELCEFLNGYKEEYKKQSEIVERMIKHYNDTEESNIQKYIDSDYYRTKQLDYIKDLGPEYGYIYNSFFTFMRVVITKLNEMSEPDGAFEAYNKKLCIILDVLISIPIKKIPPSFFGMLASELNSVASYIDLTGNHIPGKSWSATDSWMDYKKSIPQDVTDQLMRFSNSSRLNYFCLRHMLDSIDNNA